METMKAIAKRKSTRAFTSDQISEEALNTILAAGCAAPVGMGKYEALRLTVIQDAALLKKISQTISKSSGRDGDPLYGTPTLIVISVSQELVGSGLDYANASCVTDHMLLAATDLGLGSVFLWGAPVAITSNKELRMAAGIPAGYKPLTSVAVGFPAQPDETEKELKVTIALNRV